jgi:hypothetical protein
VPPFFELPLDDCGRPGSLPDNKQESRGEIVNLEQSSSPNDSRTVANCAHGLSEAQKRLRVLELSVHLLIARTKSGDFWADGFDETGKLLETVPLTTSEFDSARVHLENARGYGRVREFGAAAFELRIVRGILQRL